MLFGPILWHRELQHQAWVSQQHRGLRVSLHSAPRVFSTSACTPTCFPSCYTAKSYQRTLASNTWKCWKCSCTLSASAFKKWLSILHKWNSTQTAKSHSWPCLYISAAAPKPHRKKHVQPPGSSAHVVGTNPSSEHTVWCPVTAAEKQRLEVLHLVLLSFVWHIKHRALITAYCST